MGVELTHSQSVNRLEDITTELERLAEKDQLSPEDKKYWEELRTEFGDVNEHRERLERAAELAQIRGADYSRIRANAGRGWTESGSSGDRRGSGDGYDRDAILEPDSVENHRFRHPWDLSEMRTLGRGRDETNAEYRSRALSAIEKMPAANDRVREAGTQIVERHDDGDASIARMVLASSSPAYMRAWSKMATNRQHELKDDEVRALEAVRAMSLTDSAGGYLVPFQLDPTVIITANGSSNEIRQIARTVVATGDVWNGVSSGAVAWSWDAEALEVSDDATTFAQPSVPVYKAAGFVPISIEALEDAANITANVADLLAFGRDVLEAGAFVNGTGVGQPSGIVTALTATTSELAAATNDTFALADVYNLHGALPSRYRRGASWLANVLVYNRIRQFDTSGGAGLWANIGQDQPQTLLGRRAVEAEDMTGTVTAAAANRLLVFGDFSNYVIADRVGMTVEFIPHLFGVNRRPTGQRGWYAYYRVGADSVNDAAFRSLVV